MAGEGLKVSGFDGVTLSLTELCDPDGEQKDATTASLSTSYGGWFSPVKASGSLETSSEHVTTVQSAVEDTSESKAEVKAKLTGEVRVNFKSDYFPMEKMANSEMIAAIQGNSKPPAKATTGA